MLYLPRLVNESIMIGDEIEVRVARIDGASVCLAINAPREMAVNRKEIHKQLVSITKRKRINDKYTPRNSIDTATGNVHVK